MKMSRSQQYESPTMYINLAAFTNVLVITIIILMILKFRRQIVLANRIPGPRGSFIIGSLPMAMKGPELAFKQFLSEYRMYEKSLIKFWILHRLYIVLTKPEDIEMVLTDRKYLNKSKEYEILQESIFGEGLVTIKDENKWKNNRKVIIRGLDFTLLKSFIPIMFEEANVLVEILREKRDRKTNECDIIDPMTMATLEIIGRTSMGVRFNAQRGGQNPFAEHLYKIMDSWEYRMTHPWYLSNILYHFSSVKRQHDRSQKIMNEFVDQIIESKTIELNERAIAMNTNTQSEDFSRKNKTIIEILLQNPHGMSYQYIRDEIVTILNGGQETTAMTNACAILMLALHQDIQDKAYEEQLSIFPAEDDRHRPPTFEDLLQMKYLERVIKETLRLFPPLPLTGRSLNEDTEIGGYLCPAGATLLFFPVGLHTSPLYYDNPNRFNPDNFLPEAVGSRHHYSWIPFSAGIRNCIGIKFAMIQMKIIISTLLRSFKFSPSERCPTPEHIRHMFLIALKFVDGCYVRIEPRT